MKKPKPDPPKEHIDLRMFKAYLAEIGRKGGKVVSEKKLEHLKKARAAKNAKRKLYANDLTEKWRQCEEKGK